MACTAIDVELLSRRGVIAHGLGNNGELARCFADLCKGIVFRAEDPDGNVPGPAEAVPEPAAAVDGVAAAEVLPQPVARRRARRGGSGASLYSGASSVLCIELRTRSEVGIQ